MDETHAMVAAMAAVLSQIFSAICQHYRDEQLRREVATQMQLIDLQKRMIDNLDQRMDVVCDAVSNLRERRVSNCPN